MDGLSSKERLAVVGAVAAASFGLGWMARKV